MSNDVQWLIIVKRYQESTLWGGGRAREIGGFGANMLEMGTRGALAVSLHGDGTFCWVNLRELHPRDVERL